MLEQTDNGVDGLFIKNNNEAVSYQVKFRSNGEAPTYDDLTSFWAESEYTDERCIFANCYALPHQAYKKKNQFMILRDSLTSLSDDFFEWFFEFANSGNDNRRFEKYTPLPHQKKIINDVINGFTNNKRGKLLAACGTGKTLEALWISERLDCKNILFVAPNLGLIKQTLESWMPQAEEPFNYLCVCSDKTVAENNTDEYIIDSSYIDVPVTTDSSKISEFVQFKSEKRKVIFSTYQSLDSIVIALSCCNGFKFDIALFDEAHRTAGDKNSTMFTYGLSDDYLPCNRRLFMTATERLVSPRIVSKAKEYNYEIFSMDNIEQYGPTFSTLSFRDAIEQKIISDYKIVLCCMKENELKNIIESNRLVSIGDLTTDAQTVFKQVLLSKAINKTDINKIISYHYNIEEAKSFIESSSGTSLSDIICKLNDDVDSTSICTDHINGRMSAGKRKKTFDKFVKAQYGIISNARCLTEGIDVPIIDAVYFADPKNSVIDIIQAVGRSLRTDKTKPDKISYIIIPLIVSENVKCFNDIEPKEFSTLHSVIQAMRDQDRILADYIDEINLIAAKGRKRSVPVFGMDSPITIEIFENFEIEDFAEGLSLRIAEVNKDPDDIDKNKFISASRKSGVKRNFRTISDYNIDTYYNNLVLPTLKKFDYPDDVKSRKELRLCNNNVSHSEKIGAIEQKEKNLFVITDVGTALLENEQDYKEIFKKQLLKYYETDKSSKARKFPYRTAMRVISKLGYLTRFEFAYSLYISENSDTSDEEEAVKRVQYIRNKYPNIEVLSKNNKKMIIDLFNEKFNTSFIYDDIESTKTTVYNQFNYLKKHLLNWDNIFDSNADSTTIKLKNNGEIEIDKLLSETNNIEICEEDELKKLYLSTN